MGTPPNVVVVVLDTFRRDRTSLHGYGRETTPALEGFAADATTFTDAVAQGAWSVPSHASLFTGLYPREHGATTLRPVFRKRPALPELLSGAGYETYAVSPNEYVRPLSGFGRGFDEFHVPSGTTVPQRLVDLLGPAINRLASSPARYPPERLFNAIRADATTATPAKPADNGTVERVEDVLGRARAPFFLFVNVIDAHLPRTPDPAHLEAFVDDALRDAEVVTNERAHAFGEGMTDRGTARMSQLYDADLRTADDRLGRLLGAFESAGVLEDSLVVLVSDHGEHLGEFGLVGHQRSVFEEVVSVPLVVRFPGGGPDCIEEQVEIRRLFHTVLDEAGVEAYPDRSLAAGTGDEVARGAYFTPMLDLRKFLREDAVVFDRELLGESLSFARGDGYKRLAFAGEEWLFALPESDLAAVPREP